MINWDELKHIHVIRKLEAILEQWFNAELFFIDERGQVRNFESKNEFKNSVAQYFLKTSGQKQAFLNKLTEYSELVYRNSKPTLIVDGLGGCEKAIVSRISIDNEFLGAVCVYSFLEKPADAAELQKASAHLKELGLDPEAYSQAVRNLKPLTEAEKKYFSEIAELVVQEIVTLHTEITKREERISALSDQLGNRYSYDQMIGKSKPMQDLYNLLDKVRGSEASILIQGENGTGKELIARAVHFNSPRKTSQFVTVNCSAFNENLLDSELFGHIRGAFTGAIKDKKGLFEASDKGTLFLDEIGDMSLSMQVKLLRVLQEGTFLPVGATETRKVDVRVLAATNKDLKEMVENGEFREDLYFRINVINIVVPPLRDRKEDIPVLIDAFLAKGCKEKGLPIKQMANRTLEKIFDYHWPGNIRELQNEIERLIVLSGEEPRIGAEILSPRIRDAGDLGKAQGVRVAGKLKDALEELEKVMIKEGLRRTGWNKSRLAKELGISRAGLIMKVEKYGLDKRKILRKDEAA